MTMIEMADLMKEHSKKFIPSVYQQMVVIGNLGSQAETSVTLALRVKGTLNAGVTDSEE